MSHVRYIPRRIVCYPNPGRNMIVDNNIPSGGPHYIVGPEWFAALVEHAIQDVERGRKVVLHSWV